MKKPPAVTVAKRKTVPHEAPGETELPDPVAEPKKPRDISEIRSELRMLLQDLDRANSGIRQSLDSKKVSFDTLEKHVFNAHCLLDKLLPLIWGLEE